MKEVILGTFYGQTIYLSVPSETADSDWQKKWEDHREQERRNAVDEYKENREKERFGDWFFKWNSKRVKKELDKIDLDVKDITIN